MDKPGGHRTGLNAHFGVDTSVLRNTSRNWPGIGGADAAPEPLALRVDNADRGRLLRYVRPNIMRHRNLRWCKSPGNMPGSRHYRCLRLRTAITRGPQMLPRIPQIDWTGRTEGCGNAGQTADSFFHPSGPSGLRHLIYRKTLIRRSKLACGAGRMPFHSANPGLHGLAVYRH